MERGDPWTEKIMKFIETFFNEADLKENRESLEAQFFILRIYNDYDLFKLLTEKPVTKSLIFENVKPEELAKLDDFLRSKYIPVMKDKEQRKNIHVEETRAREATPRKDSDFLSLFFPPTTTMTPTVPKEVVNELDLSSPPLPSFEVKVNEKNEDETEEGSSSGESSTSGESSKEESSSQSSSEDESSANEGNESESDEEDHKVYKQMTANVAYFFKKHTKKGYSFVEICEWIREQGGGGAEFEVDLRRVRSGTHNLLKIGKFLISKNFTSQLGKRGVAYEMKKDENGDVCPKAWKRLEDYLGEKEPMEKSKKSRTLFLKKRNVVIIKRKNIRNEYSGKIQRDPYREMVAKYYRTVDKGTKMKFQVVFEFVSKLFSQADRQQVVNAIRYFVQMGGLERIKKGVYKKKTNKIFKKSFKKGKKKKKKGKKRKRKAPNQKELDLDEPNTSDDCEKDEFRKKKRSKKEGK